MNRTGPSLHGVVGREAGAVSGFAFSPALRNSGITWTEDELSRYLEHPQGVVPGTRMAFAGLRDPQDRAAVIAYLQAQTLQSEE